MMSNLSARPCITATACLAILITGCGRSGGDSASAAADEDPTTVPPHPSRVAPGPGSSPPAVANPTVTKKTMPRPAMLTRQEWKAKEPRGEGKEHTISRITVHHTAVAQNIKLALAQKLQNLQHFSQNESRLASGKTKPAWFDVPYHFYIAFDGKIAEGRPIKFASDTNTEYDPTSHATIVLEGNFENEQVSAEQQASLVAMMSWLASAYKVPKDRIGAHNDFAKTACPGVNLKKVLPELVEKATAIAGSAEKP